MRRGKWFAVVCILFQVHNVGSERQCLSFATSANRSLTYPDKTLHPVAIPYPLWDSVRMAAEVANILLSEVMGYSTTIVQIDSLVAAEVVNHVAGCPQSNDCNCPVSDTYKPSVHFTLESWADAVSQVECLPADKQPKLLNILDYTGDDTYFLWQRTIDAAWRSDAHLALDYYRSYDANFFKPHMYFDPLERLLSLLPSELLIRCSDMTPESPNARDTQRYIELTNDTDVSCHYNDTVWFSPACRRNSSECIPVMMQYLVHRAMQHAFFLNWPVAIVMVGQGRANYSEFYQAARTGNFLFQHWAPDDILVDQWGRLPVQLRMPPANEEEHLQGIFRTGTAGQKLKNYGWRHLSEVDPQVAFFASSVSFFQADMDSMLIHLSSLRARALADGGGAQDTLAREAACAWVKSRQERWVAWIPVSCDPGHFSDASMTACQVCPPGSFCPGGFDPPTLCRQGFFCVANATVPQPCPPGFTTGDSGATSADECNLCVSGSLPRPVAGACLPLPAVLVPAFALAVAAVALLWRCRSGQEDAQWKIREGDVIFSEPLEVLGRGSRGAVVKAFLRGTPVAVKRFAMRDDDGDASQPPAVVLMRTATVAPEPPTSPFARRHGSILAGRGDLERGESGKVGGDGEDGRRGRLERTWTGGGPGGSVRSMLSSLGSAPSLLRAPSLQGSPEVRVSSHVRLEMRRLTAIRHPCVSTLMGVATLALPGEERRAGPCLVMEVLELGSLWDLLHNRMFRLDSDFVLQTLRSVAQGLQFLHEARPPVLHGDLKTSNILIAQNFAAKIADIALATARARPPRERAGAYWLPPECLAGRCVTSAAADVYGFGVVVIECLTRETPLEEEQVREVLTAVAKGSRQLPLPAGCAAGATSLMADCMLFDHSLRPSAAEINRRLASFDPSTFTSPAVPPPEDGGPVRRPTMGFNSSGILLSGRAGSSPPAGPGQSSSESMMREMFPAHVAEALLRGDKVAPEAKEAVSMLFLDIVGFTSLSASLPPHKVSGMLDRLFVRLDALADSLGVHKLETIGDAYLAATNVVTPQPADHAARLARFAVAAVAAAAATPVDEEDVGGAGMVQIRVGLNSGPCMASVVGRRNPKYTLFGDTINTASRMESHSLPGRIQCTAAMAALIRAQDSAVRLRRRGRVNIKGKGTMDTYWVLLDSDPDCPGDNSPAAASRAGSATAGDAGRPGSPAAGEGAREGGTPAVGSPDMRPSRRHSILDWVVGTLEATPRSMLRRASNSFRGQPLPPPPMLLAAAPEPMPEEAPHPSSQS